MPFPGSRGDPARGELGAAAGTKGLRERGGGCPRPGAPTAVGAGGLEPAAGPGLRLGLCVPGAPETRRLFSGLREALPGCKFLVVWLWRASWDLGLSLSAGRRKEQPPSLPSLSLFPLPPPRASVQEAGGRRGGGSGGRGPGVLCSPLPCPARPGRSAPAFVRGQRGKRSQGRPAELLACGEKGEWQPAKRHFRNVNIKIGAIQPRSCVPPHPPAGLGTAFWAGAVAGEKEHGSPRQGEEVVTITGVLDCKLCFARVKFNFGAAWEAAAGEAGRRLGGAPGAQPHRVSAQGGTPIAPFVWASQGPAPQPGSCSSCCKSRLYRHLIETNLKRSSALSSDGVFFVLRLIICKRLNGSVVPEELVFSIYFSRPE